MLLETLMIIHRNKWVRINLTQQRIFFTHFAFS